MLPCRLDQNSAQAAAPVLLTSKTLRWQGRTPSGCVAWKEQGQTLGARTGWDSHLHLTGWPGQVSLPGLIFLTSEANHCPVLCSKVAHSLLIFCYVSSKESKIFLHVHSTASLMLIAGMNEKRLFCLRLSYLVFKYFLIYLIFLPLPTVEATFETTVALQGYCFFHFQFQLITEIEPFRAVNQVQPQKRKVLAPVTVTGKSSRSVCVPASWSSWQGPPPPCGFVLCHFPGGFNSVLRCQLRSWILSHLSVTPPA